MPAWLAVRPEAEAPEVGRPVVLPNGKASAATRQADGPVVGSLTVVDQRGVGKNAVARSPPGALEAHCTVGPGSGVDRAARLSSARLRRPQGRDPHGTCVPPPRRRLLPASSRRRVGVTRSDHQAAGAAADREFGRDVLDVAVGRAWPCATSAATSVSRRLSGLASVARAVRRVALPRSWSASRKNVMAWAGSSYRAPVAGAPAPPRGPGAESAVAPAPGADRPSPQGPR